MTNEPVTNEPVAHVRVRAGGRVDDVVCVTVEPGVPVSWLRSADVLVLPEGSHETVEQVFLRFPGCSIVVVTGRPAAESSPSPDLSPLGTRNLVHVRGGAVPRAAAGDPRPLGALAHARGSLARGRTGEAGRDGSDRTVVVSAGPPRAD